MHNIVLRPLTASDEPLIWQLLLWAAHEDEPDVLRGNPQLACYAAEWGRAGDGGWVALQECGGEFQLIGGLWLRRWPLHCAGAAERGFGYIDERTPEMAIAVAPAWRGQGVGSHLLTRALGQISTPLSLNVRADNPAVRLYQRFGFEKVPGSEVLNRTGTNSFTMCWCPQPKVQE